MQLSLFPETAYSILPVKENNTPYRYSVTYNGKLLCNFIGLDMACSFIRHELAKVFVPYKQQRDIVDNCLAQYRKIEDA